MKIPTKIIKLVRKINYKLTCLKQFPKLSIPENIQIDVVIPTCEKDLDVLDLCVEGVRRCVANPISTIFLVGAKSEAIIRASEKLGLQFVDERTVLGYNAKDINVTTTSGRNRSGWIFQQLLKLSGKIGDNRYFLVIDSDHILLRKHIFIDSQGHSVCYMSREYNYPYYEWLSRVLGIKCSHIDLSYVAHKMIFDRKRLAELQAEIERHTNETSWDIAIVNTIDRHVISGFSEYETYGHWLREDEKVKIPWQQKSLHKYIGKPLPSYDFLQKRFGHKYLSVTFPDYMKK